MIMTNWDMGSKSPLGTYIYLEAYNRCPTVTGNAICPRLSAFVKSVVASTIRPRGHTIGHAFLHSSHDLGHPFACFVNTHLCCQEFPVCVPRAVLVK